jgi:hypothetical protein
VGACCGLNNGFCTIVFQTACTGSTNSWTAGGNCQTLCPNSGKCCLATGECTLRTQSNCANVSGVWTAGETCASPCPDTGACCNPVAGTCTIVTQAACGCGDIWSSSQTCAELCPVPVGACCNTLDGRCFVVTYEFCNGFVAWTPGVTCDTPCSRIGERLPDAVFSIPLQTTIPATWTDTLTVADTSVIQTIEAWLSVDLNRLNDLKVRLTGPNNATADLFVRIGANAPACATTPVGPGHTMLGTYIFQDSASQSLWSYVTGPLTLPTFITAAAPGRYQPSGCGGSPVSLDATFGGIQAAGTWTLTVIDERSGINAIVNSWGISINGMGSTPCSVPCPGDHNHSGIVDADDLFAFLDDWFAQNGTCVSGCSADYTGSPAVDPDDLFAYLDLWFANNGTTCP